MSQSTKDRILYLLKSRGPQTLDDLSRVLEISKPGVQQTMAKLASALLVDNEDKANGRGRPKRFWHLTEKGHARFPDRHSDLTLEIIQTTKAVFGEKGLERIIHHREQDTLREYKEALIDCRNLWQKVQTLTKKRVSEGYMAECQKVSSTEFLLVENHCPICAAATICQGLCRSEISIFQSILGPNVSVERTEHLLKGGRRCTYLIKGECKS